MKYKEMYKYVLMYVIAIVLLQAATAASAQESSELQTNKFKIVLYPVEDQIVPGQEAAVDLFITNLLETEQRFRITSLATSWSLRTSPATLTGLDLKPKNTVQLRVYLQPSDNLHVGQYQIPLNVKFESDTKITELPVPIYIKLPTGSEAEYLPALDIILNVPENIDPRSGLDIKLKIDNLNRKNITDLKVEVTSSSAHAETADSLMPLEKGKEIRLNAKLDPRLAPQKDMLTVTVSAGKQLIKTFQKEISIIDYTGSLQLSMERKESFLKTKGYAVYSNEGNAEKSETARIEISPFTSLFTSTEPKAKIITDTDGRKYLAWDLALKPGEASQQIKITTSYRAPFFVIAIIAVFLIYRIVTTKPLVLKKTAAKIQKKEGGISEVKIIVTVRNITNKTLENAVITDSLPHMATLVHESIPGTISPEKVLRHEQQNDILLKWHFTAIEAYEERILTYKIKLKLSVLGGLTLQPTTARFKKEGKLVKVNSNTVVIAA